MPGCLRHMIKSGSAWHDKQHKQVRKMHPGQKREDRSMLLQLSTQTTSAEKPRISGYRKKSCLRCFAAIFAAATLAREACGQKLNERRASPFQGGYGHSGLWTNVNNDASCKTQLYEQQLSSEQSSTTPPQQHAGSKGEEGIKDLRAAQYGQTTILQLNFEVRTAG